MNKIKIKSKKSIGIKPVHDIMVDDQHHYILEDGIISHNSGFIYASSIVIAMKKLKLKEDIDGNKTSSVNGIRAKISVVKTRFNKPFENVTIKIPYNSGMSPYSGLFDFFLDNETLTKVGNQYTYTDDTGNEIKYFRKKWVKNTDNALDTLMQEFQAKKDYKELMGEVEVFDDVEDDANETENIDTPT